MTKTMTAAAALLLGIALAASAQANNKMRQSAAPANDTQQTAQTGTTAAPQATKQRTTRKLSARFIRMFSAGSSKSLKAARLSTGLSRPAMIGSQELTAGSRVRVKAKVRAR